MPGVNGTGPSGAGPMTGGARGRCKPSFAGSARPMTGYGYGYGTGFGFGRCGRGAFGNGYGRRLGYGSAGYPMAGGVASADPIEALRQQAETLKNALNDIRQKIAGLEKKE